jgi:hypothetical protein
MSILLEAVDIRPVESSLSDSTILGAKAASQPPVHLADKLFSFKYLSRILAGRRGFGTATALLDATKWQRT